MPANKRKYLICVPATHNTNTFAFFAVISVHSRFLFLYYIKLENITFRLN